MKQLDISVNLEHFLRTGVFGSIKIGMLGSEILKMLGEPDFIFTRGKTKKPTGFEYGDVEFYFISANDTRLCGIYMDDFDIPKGSQLLNIDACWIRATMSQAEVEENLLRAGISFKPTEMPDSTMSGIVTEGGVDLGFIKKSEEFSPTAGIYNISFDFREKLEVIEE